MFTVHVASAVDANYLPHVLPLARTIASTLRWPWRAIYHVLYDGPADDRAAAVAAHSGNRLRIQLHQLANPLPLLDKGHISAATYLRLALPQLLPRVRRLIYLDVDVVVHRDLSELYTASLGGKPLAGVPDLAIRANMHVDRGLRSTYFSEVLGLNVESYVNAGVLLMDLPALRLQRFTEVGVELSRDRHEQHIYLDQDVINAMLKDRIALLDPRWNYLPSVNVHDQAKLPSDLAALIALQRQDPFITHYAGPTKDLAALGWNDV